MKTKFLVALLFALLFSSGSVLAGGDAANGEALAENCAMCHGDAGEGDGGDTPALAGMDEAAHVAALKAFASGERPDESGMMADAVADLSEQDMKDLAAYYAGLK